MASILISLNELLNGLDAHLFVRDAHCVDLLQEHLVRARAAGGVFARSAAVPPWGLRLPGAIQLAVHAVIQGTAWLWVDGVGEPVQLRPGDLALVRGGPDHCIAHEPGALCALPDDFRSLPVAEESALSDRASVFLCGAYRFAGDIGQGLVDALPPILPLPANVDDPIHTVVALLSREMQHENPGRQTVLDRLLDVLVVFGLRAGLSRSATPPAWFRGASDPRLAPILQVIHAEPEKPWTVDELAKLGHMSRATFARTFQQVIGHSPMKYLTDWRMTLARDLLLTSEATLDEIAAQIGYGSVYAFATAFQRHHGQPPRRWQTAQAGSQTVSVDH
ncbi:AraC family transcriptional regulator [Mycobacterium sp. 852013-50091_SCH5140682]|uniref:AraC family transcriptional regulator n=1 Tax=Mycobacterium sp. 852013-50091_SCH5140682 TaxID=1834109 RepID=UPI0018D3A298|nr:AraC family transcriptional regulator [Mycobacterium sp. 852013-50091_SCH5140682]